MINIICAVIFSLTAVYFVIAAIGGGSWAAAFFACSTCFYSWQMPLPRKSMKPKPPKAWEDHVI